ncbi:MAG: acylphosphatase [Gammaproteobacteria bacterium]|nr:acylphosphatase [Gammaproteobacteria bacterium]
MPAIPPDQHARRIRISGRVQGVFFRASTAERAQALGLTGRARNCPDGSVEVLAAGAPAALAQLIEWLHHGPPLARVERVAVEVITLASADWPEQFQAR